MIVERPDWSLPRRAPTDKLDLSTNICFDWVVQSEIAGYLKNSITPTDFSDYTDELPLYSAISKHHDIHIQNISVGFGLGELAGRVLLSHKSKIQGLAIVSPTWQMIETFCKMYNIYHTNIPSPLTQAFSCNAIYIANPSGVTGTAQPAFTISLLLQLYDLVIVDESYGEYAIANCSVMQQAVSDDRLIVLKTLSKSVGVAGLRVGYSISSESTTKLIQQYRPACVANKLTVDLAPLLFEIKYQHIERMCEARQWLIERYKLPPSNGNYVLFDETPLEISNTCVLKPCGGLQRMTVTNKEALEHVLGC